MSLSDETVAAFSKNLGNLERWLDEAEAFAQARELDPELLLTIRLYPDQFELRKQIQSACDTAKLCCARMAGVQAPKHEDGEQSLAELRARIAEVRAWIADVDRSAVDAAGDKEITLPYVEGMVIAGADYVREFAVPNFYFHLTMAYACLRHCGVKLGKRSFIGHMAFRPAR